MSTFNSNRQTATCPFFPVWSTHKQGEKKTRRKATTLVINQHNIPNAALPQQQPQAGSFDTSKQGR
jgi:hypothetical protein